MKRAGLKAIVGKGPMKAAKSFLTGAVDLETTDLYNGKVVLAQIYREDWQDAKLVDTVKELFDLIFALDAKELKKTIWLIHNLEFDWRFLINEFKGRGFKIIPKQRSAGKFYEMEVLSAEPNAKGRHERITRFRDSMAFYSGTLEEFTKNFAPDYQKKNTIKWEDGERFNKRNREHREYARYDVLGLVYAGNNFDKKIYDNFQVHIGPTAPSISYQAWLRTISKDIYIDRQTPPTEEFIRGAYYGGLVGPNAEIDKEYSVIDSFDINSSYPAEMRKGVPKGRAVHTYKYHIDLPGFYDCIVSVPMDAILPIVPFKQRNNLAWGRGDKFPTRASSIEIEYWKSLGVTVEVIKGVFFPEGLQYIFNAYIDKCEKLRAECQSSGDTATEQVVKLMQNSLYGRFGMKKEGEECEINFEGQPENMEAVYDSETNETIPHVYVRKTERDTEYMHPHFSAWITANARISIDKLCQIAGRQFVAYRDTDSIHVTNEIAVNRLLPFVGKEYGKIKREKQKFKVKYHAPKSYTYTDKDGVTHATFKGVPRSLVKLPRKGLKNYEQLMTRRNELIAKIHSGEITVFKFPSVTSVNTYMKTGKLGIERTRSTTAKENIFGCDIENGQFRPRTITPDMFAPTIKRARR